MTASGGTATQAQEPANGPRDRPLRWPRLALEGAVIVGSILLAFAIDAWWDDRQESLARSTLYATLVSDMDAVQAELERVRRAHVMGLEGTVSFLQLRQGPPLTEEDAGRVDTILGAMTVGASFDAPLGAARAIVAGGDRSYLDDPELIGAVTRLLAEADNLEREQATLVVSLDDAARVLSRRGVDLSDAAYDMSILGPDTPDLPWTRRPTPLWRLAADPEIRSSVVQLYWQYRNSLMSMEAMEPLVARIRAVASGI